VTDRLTTNFPETSAANALGPLVAASFAGLPCAKASLTPSPSKPLDDPAGRGLRSSGDRTYGMERHMRMRHFGAAAMLAPNNK